MHTPVGATIALNQQWRCVVVTLKLMLTGSQAVLRKLPCDIKVKVYWRRDGMYQMHSGADVIDTCYRYRDKSDVLDKLTHQQAGKFSCLVRGRSVD